MALPGAELFGPVEEVLGYPAESFVQQPHLWFGRIHPEDRSETERLTKELYERGGSVTRLYRWQHRDGRWIWLRDRVCTERDGAGRVVALHGVASDVTDVMQAQQEEILLGRVYKALSLRKPGHALEKGIELLGEKLPIDAAAISEFGFSEQPIIAQWVRPGWEGRTSALLEAFSEEIQRDGNLEERLKRLDPSVLDEFKKGKLVYRSDLEEQRDTTLARLCVENGFRSLAALPLQQEEGKGTLLVLLGSRPNAFSESDLGVLEKLRPTFSAVLNAWRFEKDLQELNATLEKRVHQRTYELEVLYELADKFGYTLSYDELFCIMTDHLHRVVKYDLVGTLLSADDLQELRVYPLRPLSTETIEKVKATLLEAWSIMRGETVDAGKLLFKLEEPKNPELPPIEKLGSVFQVPLVLGKDQETMGFLLVAAEAEDAFGEADVRFLYLVVSQASVSIQRLRARLAIEQQRLEALMERLPEGVLLLDSQRRLVLANPAAREYLSVLTDAVVGDMIEQLGGVPMDELLAPAPGGKGWHDLVVSGPRRRVFEVSSRYMESGPEAGGWVLVVRDVTAEREMQERSEQQGRLAVVGQLAAGIAHDFNNLLTPIVGYAGIYKDSPKIPPEDRESMQIIYEQGRRASKLIKQILDFSRKSIVKKSPIQLVSFLKETVTMLERTIPENIKITLEVEPGHYVLNSNPVQLQQVITNLAVNARDAMPNGGEFRIRVFHKTFEPQEARPLDDMPPGEWVVLEFSDTGMGMSREVMQHIFEPFFTTKRRTEGTGLGLSQVYGIVKQHEGYVDVKSEVGKGTTFTIYLPPSKEEEEAALEEKGALPSGKGETILVVEDDESVLKLVEKLLGRLGYRVLTASNGKEGLKVFEERKEEIQVVLMDMVMPELGGAELVGALRAREPKVKIIVMSGYPLGEDSLPEGVADWLMKPIDTMRLAAAVAKAISANHQPSANCDARTE
jgi:PAS domain S-box-containing protein